MGVDFGIDCVGIVDRMRWKEAMSRGNLSSF